jgi:hypothetical protein
MVGLLAIDPSDRQTSLGKYIISRDVEPPLAPRPMPQSAKIRFSPEERPGVFLLAIQLHPANLFLQVETLSTLVVPRQSFASHDCGLPHEKPGVLIVGLHMQPGNAFIHVAFPLANLPAQLLLSQD